MRRAAQLTYVFLAVGFGGFVVLFFSVVMIESYGPSHRDPGRVIERIQGERTVTRCVPTSPGSARSCGSTTYPTYSVIGEREDGSTWIVVGEGAFDAMRSQRGVITVRTSDVTGRVVALEGDTTRRTWEVRGSSMVVFAWGAVLVVGGIIVLWEVARRRSDRHESIRSIDRANLWMIGPAIVVAAVGVWFAVFSKGWGLDVASSRDRYGDFLADPVDFLTREIERDDDPSTPVETGVFVSEGGVSVAIVDPVDLGADAQLRRSSVEDLLVIPAVRRNRGGPDRFDPVAFRLVGDQGAVVEPVECPSTLPAFPTVLGSDESVVGGMVCFPGSADGHRLEVEIGSGVFADRIALAYAR